MIKNEISLIMFSVKTLKKANKKLFYLVTFLAMLSNIFPIISLLITRNILNAIQSLTIPFSEVINLIIIFCTISILALIIQSAYSLFANKFNIFIMYKMNHLLMEKCVGLPYESFEDTEVYDMINRLESEITYRPFQTLNSLISIVSASATFIFVLFLARTRGELFFIYILVAIISFIFNLKIAKMDFKMRYERSSKEREIWYYSYLMTRDTAFKEVKILNLKSYFLNKYWKSVKQFISMENRMNRLSVILNFVAMLIQDILAGVIMFIVIRDAYMGVILIGSALVYINLTSMIKSSIGSLTDGINSIYSGNLYMSLLRKFLDLKVDTNTGTIKLDGVDNITVSGLYFKYPNNNHALENINFEIKKGERVAILGENGSGKSTLLKLLCGLYKPSSGTIEINGNNLDDIDTDSFKNNISVLFQDFLRFEGSLMDNVRIGDIDKEVEKNNIRKSLDFADVGFMKDDDQYLYDKYIGNWFQDGSQLSGGEWQKIALARVFYKDASIYILDEPSSALDIFSEIKVFESFYKKSEGKIGVFITHRVKIAKQADKIILLDKGKVVGIGNHEDLYENCNLYRELLQKEQDIDYTGHSS